MGLFQESEAVKTLKNDIGTLVDSLNVQYRTHEEQMARLDDRAASVKKWIAENHEIIIAGYAAFLNRFVDKDQEGAIALIDALGEHAGAILDIPVDLPGGQSVSFREFSREIYGEFDSLTIRIKRTKPGLPENAYMGVDDNFKKLSVIDQYESRVIRREPGALEFLTGSYEKELQEEKEKFEKLKDFFADEWKKNAGVHRKNIEDDVLLDFQNLSRDVRFHFRLTDAINTLNVDTVSELLKSMEDEKIDRSLLKMGVYDFEGHSRSLATVALDAEGDPQARAAVYGALVAAGADPDHGRVLDMALSEAPSPLPPDMVKRVLEKIAQEKGQAGLADILLSPSGGKATLVERMFSWDDGSSSMRKYVTDLFDSDLVRAHLLRSAAVKATDDGAKARLEGEVDKYQRDYLSVSPGMVFNMRNIDFVSCDVLAREFIFSYSGRSEKLVVADDLMAAAVRGDIDSRKKFVRLNEKSYANMDRTAVIYPVSPGTRGSKIGILNHGGEFTIQADEDDLRKTHENSSLKKYWNGVGGVLVNKNLVDHIDATDIKVPSGRGRFMSSPFKPFATRGQQEQADVREKNIKIRALSKEIVPDVSSLPANLNLSDIFTRADGFFAVESEIFNARRFSNIYHSSGDDALVLAAPNGDKIYLCNVGNSDAEGVIRSVAAAGLFVGVNAYDAVNPGMCGAIWSDPDSRKIKFLVGQKEFSAELNSHDYRAEKHLVEDMARSHGGYLSPDGDFFVNTDKLQYVSFNERERELACFISGSWHSRRVTADDARRFLAILESDRGFLRDPSGHLVNPALVQQVRYTGNGYLQVVADGSEINLGQCKKKEAQGFMDGVVNSVVAVRHRPPAPASGPVVDYRSSDEYRRFRGPR